MRLAMIGCTAYQNDKAYPYSNIFPKRCVTIHGRIMAQVKKLRLMPELCLFLMIIESYTIKREIHQVHSPDQAGAAAMGVLLSLTSRFSLP